MSAPRIRLKARNFAAGYTMVELLISVTIGLFLIGGLVTLLVTNSVNSAELNKTANQIENGRFAIQLLSEDVQHAGFLGTYSPPSNAVWVVPTSDCSTTVAGQGFLINSVTHVINVPVAIHGYDQTTATPTCTPALSTRLAGTDMLVVRRVHTTEIPVASAVANEVYFQSLNCSSPSALPVFVIDNNSASFNLTKRNCTAIEGIRKYMVHIYFVSSCNVCGTDTIPTLKMLEFVAGGYVITPLVEGIENLQIEYGLDTNNDAAPDCYVSNPDNVPNSEKLACPNAATYFATATADKNWTNVMSTKIHVLARNLDPTATWTDTRQYDLGLGTTTLGGPFNDHYKRHVYTATARPNNPAGQRALP